MTHYIIGHYPTLSCQLLMFPLHSCTNPYRIVQDTKRNIRKTRSHGNNNNNYYRKTLTTCMVIFYNPTEARSTLSFNNTNSADLFEFTEVACAPWRPRRRPSPSPFLGRRKSTQSPRCCRSIERVCSEHSSERGSNTALTLGGDGGGFSVPLLSMG